MGWMCKIYIGKICKIRYILVAFFIALVMTLQKQKQKAELIMFDERRKNV